MAEEVLPFLPRIASKGKESGEVKRMLNVLRCVLGERKVRRRKIKRKEKGREEKEGEEERERERYQEEVEEV